MAPYRIDHGDCRGILLTDYPVVDLSVQAPDGTIIDAAGGAAAGVTFEQVGDTQLASFVGPLTLIGQTDATGEWNLILEVDEQRYKRQISKLRDEDPKAADALAGRGARYSASIHTFSNLRMRATLMQDSYEPGATFTCRATLTGYGVPVDGRAEASAEVEHPDGSHSILHLKEVQPGIFEAGMPATLPGLYRFTVAALGVTFRGARFSREQILTAAVFRQVDTPTNGDGHGETCSILSCLFERGATNDRFDQKLKEWGIDGEALRKCFSEHCT